MKKKIIIVCSVYIVTCVSAAVVFLINTNYSRENQIVNERSYNIISNTYRADKDLPSRVIPIADFTITDNFPILDGATAFRAVYQVFALYTYINKNIERNDTRRINEFLSNYVHCYRTEWAYRHLLDGYADIIFCLEPSQEQLQEFKDNNLDIRLIPIGREAFVFFVNERNPVRNITVQDVLGIYSGRLTNWNELGGENNSILAYQRPKNSGSQTILEKFMGNTPIIDPKTEIFESMGAIIEFVAEYTNHNNAIGYSFLIYSLLHSSEMREHERRGESIEYLSINGIFPGKETIIDNSYPFIVDFYAIYIEKENMNQHIKPFIDWILSSQGQEIVSRYDYIPINRE
ncbi:MAG: substrate-binding domain-containing protein [Treponema sp.]|nr:substrate-binding domain-containing protein [Treponema sp.]